MSETMRQQRQITMMLVVVCVAFVLLITPNAIFYAVKPYWTYTRNTLGHATFIFTGELIFLLCDSTHAVNFYLYFLSTKRFRTRCLEMLCYCWKGQRAFGRSGRYLTGGNNSRGYNSHNQMSVTEMTSVPVKRDDVTTMLNKLSSDEEDEEEGNGQCRGEVEGQGVGVM